MFVDALRWWLSIQLIGLLALPLGLWFFRRLPDRGYSFARPLGLLLATYGTWLLSMLGLGSLSRGLLLLVGVVLLAGGAVLLGRAAGLRAARDDLRAQLPWIVLVEVLFAIGIFAGVWMRWHDFFGFGVAVQHTEQSMDLALMSGILASRQFPPQDPWLSSYPINYYYLGYLLIAALTRLSGVGAGTGFTLGIATIWALTATGTAGLLYNMMGLAGEARRRGDEETRRQGDKEIADKSGNLKPATWNLTLSHYLVPLVGVVLVLLVGNQAATLQVLAGSEKVVALGARDALAAVINGLGPRDSLPLPAGISSELVGDEQQLVPWQDGLNRVAVSWWSSRAVWDDIAQGDGTSMRSYAITEFPLFSFLLGDLHPHVLSLPWSLLALAVALNLLARRSAPEFRARGGWVEVAISAVVLGGMYAINSWDLPTYLLVYLGAMVLLYLRLAPSPRAIFWPHLLQQAGVTVLACYLVYLPYHMSFDAPTASPPIGIARSHTSLWHFMVIFGLFVVPLLALVWRVGKAEEGGGNRETGRPGDRETNVESENSKPAAGASPAATNSRTGESNSKLETRNSKLTLSVRSVTLVLILTLLAGILVGWPLFVLLPLALLAAWEAYKRVEQPGIAFTLWLFAVGALVIWGCDIIYLRDPYGTPRMNTIFKFYYQVWLIWGVAATFALWRLFRHLRPASLIWLLPTAALFVSSLTYLFVAPNPNAPPPELDGLAYLSRDVPDEAAALAWVRQNTPSDAIIALAPGRTYDANSSRLATATGRPTIVGWTQHERLWRGGQPDLAAQVVQREQDLRTLYTGTSAEEAQQLLNNYGARYVYVGPDERRLVAEAGAPPEALTKFDQFMSRVFEQGDVVLYQMR